MDLLSAKQCAAVIGQPEGRVRRVVHAGLIRPAARAGNHANSPCLFTRDQLPELARICAEHTRYKRAPQVVADSLRHACDEAPAGKLGTNG